MREYGVIHRGFWANPELSRAGDDAKLLAMYLLTSPHTSALGAFRLPDAYACDDLGWTTERLAGGYAALSRIGFIRYCQESKWVWIVKFLQWNRPANPNIRKAIDKMAQAVPETVEFQADLLDSLGLLETVTKRFQNTPSPSPSPSLEGGVGETAGCPHDEIIALYHEALPANPRIKAWTGKRQANLRTRWREDEKRQSLDYWRRFFAHVYASPFLTGQATGRDGRVFLPGLDWLVMPENFAKVIEGRYHDKAAAA